jgi:multidrug efflux pump subunit AcrB
VPEVGPALFFSLLIITVSFLPVFSLEGQEGRLFSPLAYTKTFAMAGAALLSITLVPVLMLLFIRGKILPEAKNPVNRFLIWVYRPIIAGVLRWKKLTLVLAVLAMAISALSGLAARLRVHADAQRGDAALHADLAARHVDHQGGRADADAEQRSSRASPRSRRSMARRAVPTRRPIRHRPRCSRR